MTNTIGTTPAQIGNLDDGEYKSFLGRVQSRFLAFASRAPLFTTDAELWEIYLASFPADARQFHRCHACRDFITHFGALVIIGAAGGMETPLWEPTDADGDHREAIVAMRRAVSKARVTGVFLSSDATLGRPTTNNWRHLSVTLPQATLFRHSLNSAAQAAAAKREEFNTVTRALSEFKASTFAQAVQVLLTDSLYRSEKIFGQAEWLHNLRSASDVPNKLARENIIWLAVATATDGFCHPRSSMIGTLLEDIESGMPFADVAKRFAAKMHPTQYQRPQAAPSEGGIAQAEKIVAALGIARSLERRFARLEEIQTIWKPRFPEEPAGRAAGVFAHLKAKSKVEAADIRIPIQNITWAKFARDVLPEAESIHVYTAQVANLAAITTATHADAPPILQWDSPEQRNPCAHYCYVNGSSPAQWGIAASAWHELSAVTLVPHAWFGRSDAHRRKGVIFIINGAKDSRESGLAIFPEDLRSDLRAIRSTIEAYSREGVISGRDTASACGVMDHGEGRTGLRVIMKHGVTAEYCIDRWE